MRAATSLGLVHHGFRAALVGAVLAAAIGSAAARDGRNAAMMGGAALGVLGGVALGAALASPPPPPPPRPIYVEDEPRPVYMRPVTGPVCHFERRKVWLNDIEYTYKRVEVCE